MNRGLLWGIVAVVVAVAAVTWLTRPQDKPPPPDTPPPRVEGPAPAVLERLARGVNLSNWLQHDKPVEPERYRPDDADFSRIRALGFRHVRILLDPAHLLDARGLPRPEVLGELRRAMDAAVRADLLVVLALQMPGDAKTRLPGDDPARLALGGLWRTLATTLRDVAPAHLVLEPLNEPEVAEPDKARSVVAYLASEIRAVLPKHTIAVSGGRYAAIEDLGQLRPLDDRNLVYGFHFYEPHNFTHQGANWGDPAWRLLRNFPYPSSPERVAPLLAGMPPKARELLQWHGEQRWDRARIGRQIAAAAQWSRLYLRPVWCSEFGVLKQRVAIADRNAWLRDVRETLEARGIPWTHWDYAGSFGIVTGKRGARTLDRDAVEALGLQAPGLQAQ